MFTIILVNIVHRRKIMSDNEIIKNRIIEITTELLKEYGGNTKKITSRLISEKAGIGLGSINYFFGSKEKLITECVQRIINKLLIGFTPQITDLSESDGLSDKTRLISWASQTFDFLFEHQEIACISILSDMQNYLADSNSIYTQKGFAFAIRSKKNEKTKKLLAFILVSSMQTAFLAKNIAKDILGYDLYSKSERDLFISNTVTLLFDDKCSKGEAAYEK